MQENIMLHLLYTEHTKLNHSPEKYSKSPNWLLNVMQRCAFLLYQMTTCGLDFSGAPQSVLLLGVRDVILDGFDETAGEQDAEEL